MESGTERNRWHSPGRRRLITLAGASGLAGIAGALWPQSDRRTETSPPTETERPAKHQEAGSENASKAPAGTAGKVAEERAKFAGIEGERLIASSEATDSLPLVLEEVGEVIRMEGNGRAFEGYSLVFKAAEARLPGDGAYLLVHPSIGEVELFLCPVGGPVEPARYEAVISREV